MDEDNVIWVGADSLRSSDVVEVARWPGRQRTALAADAILRVDRSVTLRDELIASRRPVYGVTTGFGDSNVAQISPEKAAALQGNLIAYHLVGSGPPAPPDVVRATMLLRANCLGRGYSGVRREVIDLLLECLSHDILPVIPERGSVGASGDLVPLCYLANVLIGEGEVEHGGRRRRADEAFRRCGLRPVTLEPKEALGLINGTSFMSAFAVLAAHDARELAFAADVCTALTVEALLGNTGHYQAVIHAHKPHPGQVRSANTVRTLLASSTLCRSHEQILEANPVLGEGTYQHLDQPVQDRYSLRCAPHVVGVLHDTLEWVDHWLEIEINSTNDNPIFDPETRSLYHGGNFYGGHVAQTMDALKVAVSSVGDLLDRQLSAIVDEKFSNGLTPGLTQRFGGDEHEAGLHHGFKGAQIACSALIAEALKLSAPAASFSRSTEAHNQDKVSLGTVGARDARTVVELVREATAIHLAALCQAADLRGSWRLGAGTRAAYDAVREHARFLDRDRRMDGELAAVADALRSGALRRAITGGREASQLVG